MRNLRPARRQVITFHRIQSPNVSEVKANITSQQGVPTTHRLLVLHPSKSFDRTKNILLPSGVSLFKRRTKESSGAPSPRRRRHDRVTIRTYRVSGALSPNRRACTRGTTRTSGNNATMEFGCSLTLKAKRHLSGYSQKPSKINYSRTR